jgi:acetoin utilization deacetylase AcuC-like enzyme
MLIAHITPHLISLSLFYVNSRRVLIVHVGIVSDPVYLEHDTGNHNENKDRLTAITADLEEHDLNDKLVHLPPRAATVDEIAMVHAREYITLVQNKAENGGGWLDSDTVVSQGSYNAALYAAGGVITATEAVLNEQVRTAFALVRPPGHHATCWQAMGFCLFNNIAIAAKYALAHFKINKILIVDFDVHHGNGTQDTFYADPNVLFFSTHQYPFFPGTGSINETGEREGKGFTINVPLVSGCGDYEYQAVFEDILAPVAWRYKPELIMVSAGYDAHWADRISSMELSVPGYVRLAEILTILADKLCDGKLIFALEGGYNNQALASSVASTLNKLLGSQEVFDPLGKKPEKEIPKSFNEMVELIRTIHKL